MGKSSFLAALAMVFIGACAASFPSSRSSADDSLCPASHPCAGVWTPEPRFAQVNVACIRVYRCSEPGPMIFDARLKLVVSGPKISTGVCSIGDGPIDGCNVCITSPPSTSCKYHFELK